MPVHKKQASKKEFKCWFHCEKLGYLYELIMQLGKRGALTLVLVNQLFYCFAKIWRTPNCYIYIVYIYIYIYILFNNFFNSPMLKSKLLENDIYEIHTVRPNLKHMSSLKPYKQLKMWTASLARM